MGGGGEGGTCDTAPAGHLPTSRGTVWTGRRAKVSGQPPSGPAATLPLWCPRRDVAVEGRQSTGKHLAGLRVRLTPQPNRWGVAAAPLRRPPLEEGRSPGRYVVWPRLGGAPGRPCMPPGAPNARGRQGEVTTSPGERGGRKDGGGRRGGGGAGARAGPRGRHTWPARGGGGGGCAVYPTEARGSVGQLHSRLTPATPHCLTCRPRRGGAEWGQPGQTG